MSTNRIGTFFSILKAVLAAAAVTLIGMFLIALLTVFCRLSDNLLMILNQLLKFISVLIGVSIAVGRGGHRGFATGATVGLLYMLSGYLLYVLLGGPYNTASMLGEILLGTAVGAVVGAILANMRPKRRRAK